MHCVAEGGLGGVDSSPTNGSAAAVSAATVRTSAFCSTAWAAAVKGTNLSAAAIRITFFYIGPLESAHCRAL